MNKPARGDAERRQMAKAGVLVIAVVVNPFSGYPVCRPTVTPAGSTLPTSLLNSIESYAEELVRSEAETSGGDTRDLDKRLERKLYAWLSGHSGLGATVPLLSVAIVES